MSDDLNGPRATRQSAEVPSDTGKRRESAAVSDLGNTGMRGQTTTLSSTKLLTTQGLSGKHGPGDGDRPPTPGSDNGKEEKPYFQPTIEEEQKASPKQSEETTTSVASMTTSQARETHEEQARREHAHLERLKKKSMKAQRKYERRRKYYAPQGSVHAPQQNQDPKVCLGVEQENAPAQPKTLEEKIEEVKYRREMREGVELYESLIDEPELHREDDDNDRFVYSVDTYDTSAFISWVKPRDFWVYKVDVPYLTKHEPFHMNNTNCREFQKKVLRHYEKELTNLLLVDEEEWAERRSGLMNWCYHHLGERADERLSVAKGNTAHMSHIREANRMHDKDTPQRLWSINWSALHPVWQRCLKGVLAFLVLVLLFSMFLIATGRTGVDAGYAGGQCFGCSTEAPELLSSALIPPRPPQTYQFHHINANWFYEMLHIPIFTLILRIILEGFVYLLFATMLVKFFVYRASFCRGKPPRWRYFSLVYRCPILMAKIEEWLKCIPGVAQLIGAIESVAHGSDIPWHFHTKSMRYHQKERVQIHEEWNRQMFEEEGPLYEYYVEFAEGRRDTFDVDAVLEYRPRGAEMPSITQPSGPERHVYGDNPELTRPLTPCPLGTPPLIEEVAEPWMGELFCLVPAGRPGRSLNNLLACVNYRLCNVDGRPEVEDKDKTAIREFAQDLFYAVPEYAPEITVTEWVSSLKPKHLRRLENSERLNALEQYELHNTIFGKTDELLRIKITPQGRQFIQRPIINCSDQMWHATAIPIRRIQEAFAAHYPYDCEIRAVLHQRRAAILNYRVYYACGATASSLDRFWNESLKTETDCVHQLAMGDDSAIVWKLDGQTFRLENDFTSYDSFQYDALLDIGTDMLQALDAEAAEIYRAMYGQEWRVQLGPYKPYQFDTPLGWFLYNMRMTGENGTSVFNTAVNVAVTLRVCQSLRKRFFRAKYRDVVTVQEWLTTDKVVAEFKRYGLLVKCTLTHDHGQDIYPTFLKGVFIRHTDGLEHWMPLPSRITKLGKFMKSPRITDKRRISEQQKVACAVLGQWRSFGNLDHLTPAFMRITDCLTELARGAEPLPVDGVEWQPVHDTTIRLDHNVFVHFLKTRYDIDYDDWVSCCRILTSVRRFPAIWSHPAALKLYLTDY